MHDTYARRIWLYITFVSKEQRQYIHISGFNISKILSIVEGNGVRFSSSCPHLHSIYFTLYHVNYEANK